jgi:signal transduction histidine kinase
VLLSKTLHSSTLKLAFTYIVLFCAAIFAVLGYAYWTGAAYLYRQSDAAITSERGVLSETYDSAGLNSLIALIGKRIGDRNFNHWAYLLVDGSLSNIAGNVNTWPAELHGNEGWRNFTPRDGPPGWTGRPLFRATYQTLPDGYRLLVARDIGDLEQLRMHTLTGLGLAAALFFILATAAGISTSRRSVARIESINATTRQIMRSGLSKRIPVRGTRDDWDGLAENLNSMLDRIQELVEWNRQVSDNVAHDLRTPLTRLRGRLEKASTQRLDVDQYRALLNDTVAALDEILKIFSSLLRISQIEMGERPALFRRLDLTEIAREVIDLYDPAAEEEGVRLQFTCDERECVIGDRDLLFDAISNLVDNAIRHGGRDGYVEISVTRAADGPIFSVADRGPGIPIEERRHVLRRFYRLERSRNSPGNGLGLSLVAAVADLHDARIEMADNHPGLRIELHFRDPQPAQSLPDQQDTRNRAPATRS